MRSVEWAPLAEAELIEALSRSPNHHRILESVSRAVDILLAHPELGENLKRYGVRRWIMTKLPYSIVYKVDGETIKVVAFAHAKRKPTYWKDRLNEEAT